MSLNPRIKTISLGIHEIKEYTIYPLSMADEFKLIDRITNAAGTLAAATDSSDMELVGTGIGLIKENIEPILELVTKEDNRPTLDDIDNVQFTELIDLIYEINFGGAAKNVQSLVGKIKNLFPSTRPSQGSFDLPATD